MGADGEVWRVYLPEWLIMYTSSATGNEGWEECQRLIGDRFSRSLPSPAHHYHRIIRADTHLKEPASAEGTYSGHYCVQLLLPNLRGEYRDPEVAQMQVDVLGSEASLVARDSPGDKAFRRRWQA